jgi:predicted transcriptional regulator of viral defense system
MPGETWERLYEHAVAQYGFVTRSDAKGLGVDPQYLTVLARRGVLEHTGFGLYRFPQVPTTDRTPFMEAVLLVGEGAFLTHDAVLALHELALVNPRAIKVGTTRRVRRNLPPSVELVRRTDDVDVTEYEGIRSTTVARALRDCVGTVPRDRLRDALEEARRRGLVRRRDLADLTDAIGAGVR